MFPEELYYDKFQGIYWYMEDEQEKFWAWIGEETEEESERAIEKSISVL